MFDDWLGIVGAVALGAVGIALLVLAKDNTFRRGLMLGAAGCLIAVCCWVAYVLVVELPNETY